MVAKVDNTNQPKVAKIYAKQAYYKKFWFRIVPKAPPSPPQVANLKVSDEPKKVRYLRHHRWRKYSVVRHFGGEQANLFWLFSK